MTTKPMTKTQLVAALAEAMALTARSLLPRSTPLLKSSPRKWPLAAP